ARCMPGHLLLKNDQAQPPRRELSHLTPGRLPSAWPESGRPCEHRVWLVLVSDLAPIPRSFDFAQRTCHRPHVTGVRWACPHFRPRLALMSGGIYLLRGEDELLEMIEQRYDSEEILQALIAKFPSLLAGDQYGATAPRRWLLIAREVALPGEEDGG